MSYFEEVYEAILKRELYKGSLEDWNNQQYMIDLQDYAYKLTVEYCIKHNIEQEPNSFKREIIPF